MTATKINESFGENGGFPPGDIKGHTKERGKND